MVVGSNGSWAVRREIDHADFVKCERIWPPGGVPSLTSNHVLDRGNRGDSLKVWSRTGRSARQQADVRTDRDPGLKLVAQFLGSEAEATRSRA